MEVDEIRWFWLKKGWVMFSFPLFLFFKRHSSWKMVAERFLFFYIFPLQFIPSAFCSRGCPPELQRNPTPSSPTKEAVKLTGWQPARSNEIGIKLYIALKLVVLLWCWLQMSLYHGEVSGGKFFMGFLAGGLKHFLFSPRTLGKWSNLTNIFQMGWNHQLVFLRGFACSLLLQAATSCECREWPNPESQTVDGSFEIWLSPVRR